MSNSDPSSPVQTKGLRSFSVSAPYPSNHEVDNARLILENNNSNFVRFKKGKSRTIDKRTVYEEIEGLQTELLKREKDYQLVVEVGKMLLEKNKELSDQDEMLKRQFNHSLQERDTKITQLCSKLESYETLERDMLNEIKGLRLQVNSFKSGNDSSEAKALELYNEYKKVEEELKQAKQQLVQQRTKNKELVEESEKYKSELEALQTNERILRRQLKSTSSMLSVASENLNSPRKEAESEVTQDKLAEDLKMTQRANQRLEKQLEDLFKENSKLKEQVEQREQAQDQLELTLKALHSTNQRLQRQEEEQKRLLEEKVTVISNLQNQIEESIVGGPHSLIGFRSSKSLDRELLQSNLNKMQEEEKRGGRRKSVGRTTSTEFSSLAAELSVANLENSNGNSLAAELGIATDFKKTKSVSFDGNNEGTSPNSLRNSNSNNPLSNSSDVGLQKSRSNSSTNSMNVVEQKTRSNSSTNSINVTEQKSRSNSTTNKYEEQSNTTSTPVSPSTSTTHTNEETPVISVTTTETPTATPVTTNTNTPTTTTRSVLEVSSPLTPTPEDEEEEQDTTTTKATSSPIRVPPLPLVDTDTDNNSLSSNQSGFSRENSIDDNLNKTYEEEYIDSAEEEEFQPIETMDKSQLSEELIKFRDHKREESKYSRMFAEMRERLNGAEIRNLTRLMRTQNFIFDLIDISNSIIDGVSKDIQNKILDNPPDNPLVHLLAAVLYETCRLRKISNDYMEAINRGTVEKLEEWTKKFYEAEQQTLMQQQQDLQQSHSNTNSPADSGKKKNWFWQKWFDKNEN